MCTSLVPRLSPRSDEEPGNEAKCAHLQVPFSAIFAQSDAAATLQGHLLFKGGSYCLQCLTYTSASWLTTYTVPVPLWYLQIHNVAVFSLGLFGVVATLGLSGAPLGLSGAPLGLSGAPLGLSGAPLGLSGAPLGLSGAPLGLSGAPLGLSGAPLGLSGAVHHLVCLVHHLVCLVHHLVSSRKPFCTTWFE